MSNLRAWHGFQFRAGSLAAEVVVVSKTVKDAAKLTKIKLSDFPFRFTVFPLPQTVVKPGLYRRGVGGVWVRDEPAKGPPDLEDP